jgi:hypothetical protein
MAIDFLHEVQEQYPQSAASSDGFAVIDRNGLISFMDSGFAKILECDPAQTLSLGSFLPHNMPVAAHNQMIKDRYAAFDQALLGKSPVDSQDFPPLMELKPDQHGEIVYFPARTQKGSVKPLAIELCPLIVRPGKEGIFLLGFVVEKYGDMETELPSETERAQAIKALTTQEAIAALENQRLKDGIILYDVGVTRLRLVYRFLAFDLGDGSRAAKRFAALTIAIALTLLGLGGSYFAYTLVKEDVQNNIRMDGIDVDGSSH